MLNTSHPWFDLCLICLVTCLATAVNAVAGGGTFLAFPVLTGIGKLTEKAANVTCTIGVWPGSVASIVAALRSVAVLPRGLTVTYTLLSLAGGAVGAELLEHTSETAFYYAIPWLLLFATTVFALGKRIARWARREVEPSTPAAAAAEGASPGWAVFVGGVQFVLAVYGGYFGAGMGVLTLAGLSLVGLTDLRQVNVLKVLMSAAANLSAIVVFLVYPIPWRIAGPMAAVGTVGGFFGMLVAQRLPPAVLRGVILTVASLLTAAYFWKVYLHG